jgi:hypothetical protein
MGVDGGAEVAALIAVRRLEWVMTGYGVRFLAGQSLCYFFLMGFDYFQQWPYLCRVGLPCPFPKSS